MFNTTHIGARLMLLAALVALSQSALGLGLGNVSVESYLNQPLRARIELITRDSDDLSTATFGLASADDFALIGASREAISVPLSFTLEQNDTGAGIVVTSTLPVKDPVIRLIVELNWANGRLLREYTLFLDPPSFPAQAPAPVIDERGRTPVAPPPAEAAWVPAQAGKPGESTTAPSGVAAAGRSGPIGNEYGPVKGGETLWNIAKKWSAGTGLNTNAVMLAIQQNNPQAFINGNINLLMRGAILRMPKIDDVRQISEVEARNEVLQQSREFAQEKLVTAAETPLVDSGSQSLPMTDTGERNAPADRLELVPPAADVDAHSVHGSKMSTADANASVAIDELRQELSRKEEELIVEQQKNQDLEGQIAELQDQLRAGQEGNVADANLAQLEDQLRQKRLSGKGAEGEGTPEAEAPRAVVAPPQKTRKPAVPQVTTSQPLKPAGSWFGSLTMWLIVLLVIGAGTAGWILNRRAPARARVADSFAQERETLRDIKDEAAGILDVLKTDEGPRPEDHAKEKAADTATGVEQAPAKTRAERQPESYEAELLDEESADPEVRLDLARAYISMGDREAARVILDEVVEHGNEVQKGEAEKMLKDL